MSYLRHNRLAWNRQSAAGGMWSTPVDSDTIAKAKAGEWQIILTPKLPVPHEWFGDIAGKRVLCLASGGGQQVPVLAAAGADVVSFDLSDEQLAKDRLVAERDGLSLRCIQGDMADLTRFAAESFDLIFHPVSNIFVPDVKVVWRECHRVLRPGGELLAGFMNPATYLFDDDETEKTGVLTVRYSLPYSDLSSCRPRNCRPRWSAASRWSSATLSTTRSAARSRPDSSSRGSTKITGSTTRGCSALAPRWPWGQGL